MANTDTGPSKFQLTGASVVFVRRRIAKSLSHHVHNKHKNMIATIIPLFHAINAMPIVLDPARLEDGGGIEETLSWNKAPYHQSCRLMFNNTKLERARKRRAESGQPVERQTKLRRTSLEGQTCFTCDKEAPSSELRQIMTMNLNNRLNECVQTLNDGKLLSRLSGGDAIAQELKYYFHA